MSKVHYYTTQEIADRFQIAKKTLYRWEKSGKIPHARRAKNRYRIYTEEDIELIEKLAKEGRMNWTKNVINWIAAKEVTPDLWKMMKSEYPEKYKKIQRDVKAWGINNVKIGFNEVLRPEEYSIAL